MALDIWVGDWDEKGSKLVASFEPEAYYSFLLPVFEDFEKEKGIMIDPYDGAFFAPEDLGLMDKLVAQAESLVLSQPERFDVIVGVDLGSYFERKNEEIYFPVVRGEFIDFIRKWKSAISLARKTKRPLIFYGD